MIIWLQNHLSTCFFVKYFGIECPSCGMQRALIALLKGEFLESLHYNPALIPFLLTISFVGLHLLFKFKNGAMVIVIGFCITVTLMIGNYSYKQYLHLKHLTPQTAICIKR